MAASKIIHKIFTHLTFTYGLEFTRNIDLVDYRDLTDFWAKSLNYYVPEKNWAVDWALDNLPIRCPNLIEFRNLCSRAPLPLRLQPKQPECSPVSFERRMEIEREISELMKRLKSETLIDAKAKTRAAALRILDRVKGGEKVSYASLNHCRQILGEEFNILMNG